MNSEEIQVVAFEIILHSGNARTLVHQAFDEMRKRNFIKSNEDLKISNDELLLAHKAQSQLLKDYASGNKIDMEVILVHAQDHLMTTMTLREMAIEMQHLYEEVQNIENSNDTQTETDTG
ncbi:PTS cellobiose transporter subunit IIA [Leuconostoc litchii]|uniref:PTS cellobiose transporter subunit IIA n=1 Tax=Leuconostoc litchii TaxID=1981069 RepID=A0A6P2CNB5_9LACO|nr:PTS cellobiose transporter subunit IIA [Leuconostoc litchii]TYC47074.1 PTS cellobiose transporter subunit IIA [Leuconostoc litchii]GMA69011.1 PTS cellobiose transporter subunit IIA [Leuconostoc litchii]